MKQAVDVCADALKAEGYEVARKGKSVPLGEQLAIVNPEDATIQTIWISEPEEAG